ncbi:MAG TPA: glycoside hydrolase family 3 N-terminal domain-containing protein [Pseudonocardiaceae bacterium]|jgi:beta-N-acetylhexosaminidase|nr:glycoside hydrolase family 3 N-terminal domain-containing protein [Pseudonocardiaceae bacterium]
MLRRVVRPALLAATAAATIAALCTPAIAASTPASAPTQDASARIERQVDAIMAKMTLQEKIGQLFVVDAYGQTADTTDPADVTANNALFGPGIDNATQMIDTFHPGGVIYFAWTDSENAPQQTATLSNGLQQAAMASDGIPLQISTDQEGGVVTRIGAPGSVSPGNMAIGATFNPVDAYQAATVTGQELRAQGINMDDAPVVDVNTNPQNSADGPRSFGDNTAMVQAFATAAVTGYQNTGIAAQAKHFPGLGDTTTNTDSGVAVTSETRQQIMSIDVPSFRAAIAAGVKSIMAAHIVAPALDPSGLPASLSSPIVTGLLRDTLHYNGVVITDSLSAGALAPYTHQQIITDAINAGDDELLICPEPSGGSLGGAVNLPESEQIVLNAVDSGQISVARIDQSVSRILHLKASLGLFGNPYTTSGAVTSTVGTPAHLAVMAKAAQQSITLLRNNNGVLPLAANSGKHVLVTGWGVGTTQGLANDLTAKGLDTQLLWTGSPNAATIAQAVAAAENNDVTVVTSYNAWGDTTQQNLINALLATGKPVIVATVGGPYDIAYYPSAPTFLAAYDYQPPSLTALANAITGTAPTGHLPVTIPTATSSGTLFHYGSGLSHYGH